MLTEEVNVIRVSRKDPAALDRGGPGDARPVQGWVWRSGGR